eukprot:Hpha_TRINITY_DN15688_c1_g5::TRINITY_DN15688_c1_g5_i4::g.101451::m.101451
MSRRNPIERPWNAFTKGLVGMELSATVDDDDKPPVHQTQLTEKQMRDKEIRLFDTALDRVKNAWDKVRYASYAPVIRVIPASSPPGVEIKDVQQLWKASNTAIKASETLKGMLKEWKQAAAHMDRRANLFALVRCKEQDCPYCSQTPVREPQALEKLINGADVPAAVPKDIPADGFKHEDLPSVAHYCTYLELCERGVPRVRDQYHPGISGDVGERQCAHPDCRYTALSKTDLTRHKRHHKV